MSEPPRTALTPGDVLGYRAASGRLSLLAVRAVRVRPDGSFPIVDLLDFDGVALPDPGAIQALTTRAEGSVDAGDPWWVVDGTVRHDPATDHDDVGFVRVATITPFPFSYRYHLAMQPPTTRTWTWWRRYLDAVDDLTTSSTPTRGSAWQELADVPEGWRQLWCVVSDPPARGGRSHSWSGMSALDRLHLGAVRPEDAVGSGVTRIADLLPRAGTVPAPLLPALDDALITLVLSAFEPRGSDVDRPALTRAQLVAFLEPRRGRGLAVHEADTALSGPEFVRDVVERAAVAEPRATRPR